MKDPQQLLKQLGLTTVESQTYLQLLELGSSPVSTIAKRGHLKRTNLYNILKKLEEKGLTTEFTKGTTRYFQPTEPQKLLYLQEQQKQKIEKNITNLKEAIPFLENLQNPLSAKPRVKFYQGAEGIATLLSQILNTQSFDCYFNPEIAYASFPDEVDEFLIVSEKNKLPIREIMVAGEAARAYKKQIKNPNHQAKTLPKKYHYTTDNFIFGDSVAFISYLEDSIAVVIESAEIAKAHRVAFELMWGAI